MNVLDIFNSFQTQEQAVEYLENVRWRGKPVCVYCKSESVCRHVSGDRDQQRWQCWTCHRTFSATVGTIFHGTHMPLRQWFIVLALMLNAKKSASACQIARDTGIRRATVWSMMHRVRLAMDDDPKQRKLLHGIVEVDETYVGGKPRKGNIGSGGQGGGKSPRGRATRKTPVIGVVERGGRVIAKPASAKDLSAKGLSNFIGTFVDKAASLLITDEWQGYRTMGTQMRHAAINHAREYANGIVHTNTIEGFWALVKRAWYGQHHHYSRKYMPLYISEACYKYNRRFEKSMFEETVAVMVGA